jgi:hypothetical protein
MRLAPGTSNLSGEYLFPLANYFPPHLHTAPAKSHEIIKNMASCFVYSHLESLHVCGVSRFIYFMKTQADIPRHFPVYFVVCLLNFWYFLWGLNILYMSYKLALFYLFLEMEQMNSELNSIKRTLSTMCEVQQEILAAVKKIRKGVESGKFEMGNCCHTVCCF